MSLGFFSGRRKKDKSFEELADEFDMRLLYAPPKNDAGCESLTIRGTGSSLTEARENLFRDAANKGVIEIYPNKNPIYSESAKVFSFGGTGYIPPWPYRDPAA